MITVPQKFLDYIYQSHKLVVKVVDAQTNTELEIDDGSVTLDQTAATRGSANLTFKDLGLMPADENSLLAPYGREFYIYRGLRLPDGWQHLVKLGVFRVEDVSLTEDSSGDYSGFQVVMLDRSARVIDDIFEAVVSIAGGSDYLETIADLVSDAVPNLQTDFITKTALTPTLSGEQGEDRWAFVQTMAEAIGCELYFNNEGELTLRPVAQPSGASCGCITEGEEGVEVHPALLSLEASWSRRDAHNKWIVVGDNADIDGAAPTATALDDDPASPLNYYGQFGKKAEVYHSSFITDTTMAQEAADGKKAKESGISQEVNFGSLVNPAMEPGDVVEIKRTKRDWNSGELVVIADETHVIDSITIPLSADKGMEARTRSILI